MKHQLSIKPRTYNFLSSLFKISMNFGYSNSTMKKIRKYLNRLVFTVGQYISMTCVEQALSIPWKRCGDVTVLDRFSCDITQKRRSILTIKTGGCGITRIFSCKARLLFLLLLLFVILQRATVVSILLLTCRRRCYFGVVCRCSSVGVFRAYWATIMKNGELRSFLPWRQFSSDVALWEFAPLVVLQECEADTK